MGDITEGLSSSSHTAHVRSKRLPAGYMETVASLHGEAHPCIPYLGHTHFLFHHYFLKSLAIKLADRFIASIMKLNDEIIHVIPYKKNGENGETMELKSSIVVVPRFIV